MENKQIINSPLAPNPVGPYNQAVKANNTLYISGQIAIDQKTGELILSDIASETHQVLKNIGHILHQAGLGYENVVKCSVFVKDMAQYSQINAIYASYFSEETAPASELVEVANLPKYVNIEISCIATF